MSIPSSGPIKHTVAATFGATRPAAMLISLGTTALLAITLIAEPIAAQEIKTNAVCPRDSTGGTIEDPPGLTRQGTPARNYVRSFLRGESSSLRRRETGTSAVDTTMLRILVDRTDASACRALNSALTNGLQPDTPPAPWVYFRAGDFYFVARWTPPQPFSRYALRHEAVLGFDLNFNLVGAWTA